MSEVDRRRGVPALPTMKHRPARRMLHVLLGLGPVVAFAGWLAWAAWQVQGNIIDLDRLSWGDGAARLTAHRESTHGPNDHEIENILLRVTDAVGEEVHREQFSISWDMWGWGLVAAMQVDADPELEIVFIDYGGRRPRSGDDTGRAFYLDLSSGSVERKLMTSATQDVMPVIDWWASLHNPLSAVMLLFMYYVLYLPFQLFCLAVGIGPRRRKTRTRIEPTLK